MSVLSERYNDANVVVWLLVAVAAVNWGLVGAADVNLVQELVVNQLGQDQSVLDLVYIAIGAVGVYDILETFGKL
jgi:uncharacterized membrane protein YuzA (DUF378 family)